MKSFMPVLAAPFTSLAHLVPYHYCNGFSRYWYEHHLTRRGFQMENLTPNGDWFAYTEQELTRIGRMEHQRGKWGWPLAYAFSMPALLYYKLHGDKRAEDLICFVGNYFAVKK